MTATQSYPTGVDAFFEVIKGNLTEYEFNWYFNRLVLRRYLHGVRGFEAELSILEMIDRSDPFGVVDDVALKASKK